MKTVKKTFKKMSAGSNMEMQSIVRLLTDFDERTGRYTRYNNPETHYMRVSLSRCAPENVTFYIKDLGGYVYSVIGFISSEAGTLATAWVHEDGIRKERDDADSNHPVHNIKCVTDLFAGSADLDESVPSIILAFMEQRDEDTINTLHRRSD